MDLADFKRWHWMLIGLLVGFLFGAVRLWSGPSFASDTVDTILQGEFEWAVSGLSQQSPQQILRVDRSSVPRSSSATDVTVHYPLKGDPPGTLWVTGMMHNFARKPAEDGNRKSPMIRVEVSTPFQYRTNSPYIAAMGAPGKYPSVVEYLETLNKDENLEFSYRYGWWEKPVWTMTIPVMVGFLAIGVIWPAIIDLLNRNGFGEKTAERVMKLSSGKSAPASKPERAEEELDLVWAMGTTASEPKPKAKEKSADIPIVQLSAHSDGKTANDTDAAQSEAEYRGEFYPVVKSKSAE